jgi:DtxR family Mn-dependent transcriptional regulator
MAPMDKELSDVAETYLETVYGLRENDGLTRTGEIAEALGVTPSAVTTTVARLASRGLVRRKAYRAVELTSRGEAVALRILRRHRLAERLLTDVLGIKWSEVHEPASRLSHAMTEDLTNAVDRLLKNPKTCPHGNPIPTSTGKIKQVRAEPLNQLTAGQKGIFTSIWEERRDVLRYLDSLGLIPGVSIRVVDACPFNGPIIVKVHGSRHALGQEVASSIRVSRT